VTIDKYFVRLQILSSKLSIKEQPNHCNCTTDFYSYSAKFDFYRAMIRRARLCHNKSSVRPSVTFRYVFHTGWNTSKIISWLIYLSLRFMLQGNYIRHCHLDLLLLNPKSDTHFTIPQRGESINQSITFIGDQG